MHAVCMMNGNVDEAVFWIQHGKTRSGETFLYVHTNNIHAAKLSVSFVFLCANVLMQNFKFKDFCNYEPMFVFLYTIWFFSSNICKIAHIFHLLYMIFYFSVM